MKSSDKKALEGGILLIFLSLLYFFLNSFILFWLGYLSGWLAKVTIGNSLINSFNILFNTRYFTKDMLPYIGGALAWIGSFFEKASLKNTKKD